MRLTRQVQKFAIGAGVGPPVSCPRGACGSRPTPERWCRYPLRPPQDDDLGAIGRGIADPDVARWIGPFDSAREVLERNLSRWAAGTRATFSICDQEEACVGHVWLILADPEDSDRGSVGYWLLPEARGVGVRDSLGPVDLAVGAWRPRPCQALPLAEPSNEESQRVAQRSGYVEEGVLRSYMGIGSRRLDCVVFSLLPADLTSDLPG